MAAYWGQSRWHTCVLLGTDWKETEMAMSVYPPAVKTRPFSHPPPFPSGLPTCAQNSIPLLPPLSTGERTQLSKLEIHQTV